VQAVRNTPECGASLSRLRRQQQRVAAPPTLSERKSETRKTTPKQSRTGRAERMTISTNALRSSNLLASPTAISVPVEWLLRRSEAAQSHGCSHIPEQLRRRGAMEPRKQSPKPAFLAAEGRSHPPAASLLRASEYAAAVRRITHSVNARLASTRPISVRRPKANRRQQSSQCGWWSPLRLSPTCAVRGEISLFSGICTA